MTRKIIVLIIIVCFGFLLYGCDEETRKSVDTIIESQENGETILDGTEIENGVGELFPIQGDPALEETHGQITQDELPAPINTPSSKYEVQSLVSLNVRENPNTSGKILGTVNLNTTLPYIETIDNNWHKVLYKSGIAYVSAKYNYSRLKPIVSSQEMIEKVIEKGLSVLGTPYEFGSVRIIDYNFNKINAFTGETFDCSAFVQYAFYLGANINLYGDSRTMSKQGATVNYEDIKRGDVIFMTSTARQYNTGIERIGHVGIYLGDNKLLHTYGTGGVRITEFNSFWRGRFILAKDMF